MREKFGEKKFSSFFKHKNNSQKKKIDKFFSEAIFGNIY